MSFFFYTISHLSRLRIRQIIYREEASQLLFLTWSSYEVLYYLWIYYNDQRIVFYDYLFGRTSQCGCVPGTAVIRCGMIRIRPIRILVCHMNHHFGFIGGNSHRLESSFIGGGQSRLQKNKSTFTKYRPGSASAFQLRAKQKIIDQRSRVQK